MFYVTAFILYFVHNTRFELLHDCSLESATTCHVSKYYCCYFFVMCLPGKGQPFLSRLVHNQ